MVFTHVSWSPQQRYAEQLFVERNSEEGGRLFDRLLLLGILLALGMYVYYAVRSRKSVEKLYIKGENTLRAMAHLDPLPEEKLNAAMERRRFRKLVVRADAENQVGEPPEQLSLSDITHGMKSLFVAGTGKLPGGPDVEGKSKVVPVRSTKDGKRYFVAANLPDQTKAANKLAEISRRAQTLLQALDEQLSEGGRIKGSDNKDITDNMRRLVSKHYGKPVLFAEYHNPHDLTVGSNSDKGEMIETCLRDKKNPSDWTSDNTLFRIHMHELAHSADFHFRADGEIGHGPDFKRLHQYLLTVAENLGIYNCDEYLRSGKRACGLQLSENYCGEE